MHPGQQMSPAEPRRRYLDLAHGQVHLVQAGAGAPVLLLHQTPRSIDEFRDVVSLLAVDGCRAVAVDTPGFGMSDPLATPSIAAFADVMRAVLDQLQLSGVTVVGHHTGGVIAVELAATAPDLVTSLVLSSTPVVDASFRGRPGHGVDDVVRRADGEHLSALWRGRQALYPADDPDLLERFVRDALTAGLDGSSAGHRLVREYRMEDRLDRLTVPVLLIAAPLDPYGYPNVLRMAELLPKARRVEIAGGMVPLPDQFPEPYARAIAAFVREVRP